MSAENVAPDGIRTTGVVKALRGRNTPGAGPLLTGSQAFPTILLHTVVGAALGILILHPTTMAIYWFEFHPEVEGMLPVLRLVGHRLLFAFSRQMAPMTSLLALLGACLGLGSGLYYRALARKKRSLVSLGKELGSNIRELIERGEGERLEFKESARWDSRQARRHPGLEAAIVKTIAGLLNHRGGNLMIGVADDGSIVGLVHDYHTLRRKNRDGFEQFLMTLVKKHLGGDACALVHMVFHDVEGEDVCRVLVEPATRPVYLKDGEGAHYLLRTGNATRELDVREAIKHIAQRWGD